MCVWTRADRHRVEELTARHKRELAEDAKKMHAQYLEDCDRHPEAGESLRAEYGQATLREALRHRS